MNEEIAARVVSRYLALEDQLLGFFKLVPPQADNLRTWSPTLAVLIKESCGLLESVLKHISPHQVQVEGRTKQRRDLDIQDLAVVYSKLLGLTKRKVIVLASSPPEYLDPFKSWRNKTKRKFLKPPGWWTVHNRLKHDELASMEQAKARTAICSLGGLLLCIGAAPELTRALIQQDLLYWRIAPPAIVVNWALGGFPQPRPVILKTAMFAVVLGGPPLPKNINDFKPLTHTGSHVLVPYFRRL